MGKFYLFSDIRLKNCDVPIHNDINVKESQELLNLENFQVFCIFGGGAEIFISPLKTLYPGFKFKNAGFLVQNIPQIRKNCIN